MTPSPLETSSSGLIMTVIILQQKDYHSLICHPSRILPDPKRVKTTPRAHLILPLERFCLAIHSFQCPLQLNSPFERHTYLWASGTASLGISQILFGEGVW